LILQVPRFDAKVRENSPNDIQAALDFVDNINASGGTQMLKGVEEAINTPLMDGRIRIVSFITDGYVGNEQQIIDAISDGADNRVRFFPIGVGSAPNTYLIEEMARAGLGESSYLPLREDAIEVIKEFYDRIASPILTDLEIDWGKLDVYDTTPTTLPDLFAGQPLVISARYKKGETGKVKINAVETVLGNNNNVDVNKFSHTYEISLPDSEPKNSALASIWARMKIADLSTQKNKQDEITNLGLEYSLVTQFTSFVAVEEKIVREGGEVKTIQQPIPIPEGTSSGLRWWWWTRIGSWIPFRFNLGHQRTKNFCNGNSKCRFGRFRINTVYTINFCHNKISCQT